MHSLRLLSGLVLLFGLQTMLLAQTLSDTDKEQRWADQVIDTLFDGEVLWLNASGHEFLGIEMESTQESNPRAAIIVHGIGVHPNWDQVIHPLRVGLVDYGWHTLSIQMPILPNEASSIEYAPLFDEVTERFESAIGHLRNQGFSEIVIIAHSLGASMTMRYMSDAPDTLVSALVLVGMQGGYENMVHNNVATLKAVQLPILEVYGSEDLPGVVNFAARKANAAYTGKNKAYRQIKIDGANHFFDELEDILIEAVAEWLEGLELS